MVLVEIKYRGMDGSEQSYRIQDSSLSSAQEFAKREFCSDLISVSIVAQPKPYNSHRGFYRSAFSR